MSDQDSELALPQTGELRQPTLTLTHSWSIYAASIAITSLFVSLNWYGLACLLYLAIGVAMSRFVMRQLVDFHPMYYTVAVEFSTKIRMLLFWPLQMFGLLFKLTANRLL